MVVPVLTWFIIYIFAAPVVEKAESEDSKLFLWFATRQELGWGWLGRRERSRFEKISEFHFSREKKELVALQSCNLDESIFCFFDQPSYYAFSIYLVHFSLNFWSQVCCTGGHKSWVGERTSCSIYSQHHNLLTVPTFAFLLRIYSDYPDCWRKKTGGEVTEERPSNKVESLAVSERFHIWSRIIPSLIVYI